MVLVGVTASETAEKSNMSAILSEADIVKESRFSSESGAKKSLESYHKNKLQLKEISKSLNAWRDDLVAWAVANGNFDSTSAQVVDTTYQPSGTSWSATLVKMAKGNPELAALIEVAKAEAKTKRADNKRIDSK